MATTEVMRFHCIICIKIGATSANIRQLVHRNAGNNGRIINGSPASIYDFPHQLKLVYNGGVRCGASIIHNNWAITAAHCVDGM